MLQGDTCQVEFQFFNLWTVQNRIKKLVEFFTFIHTRNSNSIGKSSVPPDTLKNLHSRTRNTNTVYPMFN